MAISSAASEPVDHSGSVQAALLQRIILHRPVALFGALDSLPAIWCHQTQRMLSLSSVSASSASDDVHLFHPSSKSSRHSQPSRIVMSLHHVPPPVSHLFCPPVTFCTFRYSSSNCRCISKSSCRSRLIFCCSMSRITPACIACDAFVNVGGPSSFELPSGKSYGFICLLLHVDEYHDSDGR